MTKTELDAFDEFVRIKQDDLNKMSKSEFNAWRDGILRDIVCHTLRRLGVYGGKQQPCRNVESLTSGTESAQMAISAGSGELVGPHDDEITSLSANCGSAAPDALEHNRVDADSGIVYGASPDVNEAILPGSASGGKPYEVALTQHERELIKKGDQGVLLVSEYWVRRSLPDAEGRFVLEMPDGSTKLQEDCNLAKLRPSDYNIATTIWKPVGSGGGPSSCRQIMQRDVLLSSASMFTGWLSLQILCDDVVVEGVPNMQARLNRQGSLPAIGHDFIRIGLPRIHFERIIKSLLARYPRALVNTFTTERYYWLDASWGTTVQPALIMYRDDKGRQGSTTCLRSVMASGRGKGWVGTAVLALSLTAPDVPEDTDLLSNQRAELAVQLQNMAMYEWADFRGPAETITAGMSISQSIARKMKPVKMQEIEMAKARRDVKRGRSEEVEKRF